MKGRRKSSLELFLEKISEEKGKRQLSLFSHYLYEMGKVQKTSLLSKRKMEKQSYALFQFFFTRWGRKSSKELFLLPSFIF